MENNSLARALFGSETSILKLNWATRHKICVGIARGLAFLHEESTLSIVHRDIKATNVLLDKDLNAKISDFGLAKLNEEENTHISTRIAGTIGYMAPEYALWEGKFNGVSGPKLEFEFNEEEAKRMIKVALLCTNASPTLRPTMSAVVSMLEGQTTVEEVFSDPSIYIDDLRFKSLKHHYQHMQDRNPGAPKLSSDNTCTGSSSASAHDLYPLNAESISLNISETSSIAR
uniref:non-specific serine/threonine protein kinase n=1 Tax=Vernicia montana TaxID=316732 RepID=A0A140G4F4_9ROSI|nr:LRR-RLK [Vernicia montana]